MSDAPINLDLFLSFNIRMVFGAIIIFLVYVNLKNKSSGYIVVIGLIVLYLFIFISGRYYLREGFQNNSTTILSLKEASNPDVILDEMTRPFYDKPIDSVDDYELSMVFENENDRELTKELRNKLMSQYPMDWTTNPPSSSNFTKGMKEGFQDASGSDTSMFDNISGENIRPPDTAGIEEEERKILKTYQPKKTRDLKTYDIDDAYTLIKKIYDAKGEIPDVIHKKDTNVYEIVGTRRKDEKVLYEDEEAPYNPDMTGEPDVVVPQRAVDLLESSDPFYDKQKRTRIDKNDYTKFSEGLERMFAPTYPVKAWW